MAYGGQTVTIPLGSIGLLTDAPAGDIPKGALLRANNVSFETGYVTKAPGSLRYNTQVLPAGVVAVHDYWPDTITQRMFAACTDGKIYRDIGDRTFTAATAITTGLGTLTPRSLFLEGGQEISLAPKKLFFFSAGMNQVKVLEGDETTFATISAPATDWTTPNFPTFGFIHRNRLWAFMKQRAYASETDDHEDFAGGGILTQNIFPGEGGDLIGGHVFKGRAFVFKEGGFVYFLDDEDPDSDNWVWRKLGSNFGLASPHGIFEITNDMIAVAETGSPTSYSAVQALGDIESADVFRMLKIENYMRTNLSLSGLNVMHSCYYEAKKQAFLTARTSYRTTNNNLIHIDFNSQSPRVALWPKDSADCLTLRRDADKVLRPIYGSSDGYVYLMDREDRLVGGSGYTAEFKTAHYDFRDLGPIAHKNKLFDFLAVEFMPQGAWNVEIDIYIDGSFSETINYAMDVRDDGLGSFTLSVDPLGRTETQTIQKPLHGSGRRISFVIRQAGANQNFALASLTVGFRMGAEQATRV
jgi:hypothetical protein